MHAFSISTLSFHGVGITVELTFPNEAHPEDNIDHNVTITSQINPEIIVFNLTIYGTINQTLQEIESLLFPPFDLDAPYSKRIDVLIPKETLGRLYCTIYAKTNQDTDYYFTSFHTTQVNPITFSELISNYDSLLSDYENSLELYGLLLQNYNSLLEEYDTSETNYNTLETDYQSKITSFNTLLEDYSLLNSTLTDFQGNYTSLQNDFSSLNQEYNTLQEEINILQEEITNSQNTLNVDRIIMIIFIIILVSLIGLIIYLKNKQKEPYVVIRKETVSIKPKKK